MTWQGGSGGVGGAARAESCPTVDVVVVADLRHGIAQVIVVDDARVRASSGIRLGRRWRGSEQRHVLSLASSWEVRH